MQSPQNLTKYPWIAHAHTAYVRMSLYTVVERVEENEQMSCALSFSERCRSLLLQPVKEIGCDGNPDEDNQPEATSKNVIVV